MAKTYNVLLKARDGYEVHRKCRTLAEAKLVMENINLRNLNKLYKRFEAKGKRKPNNEAIARVYSKTAIQY